MELTASKALAIRTTGVPVLLMGMPGDCRVYPLDRDRMVIGSELGCDVHLKLPGVAGRHLMLQRGERGFEFFDLSGVEGALLNGCRTSAAAIQHADEIAIGGAHLVMIDPEADSMPAGMQLLGLPVPLLREEAEREALQRLATGESFGDLLVDSLKRTPWVILSAAAHALIWISLLSLLDAAPKPIERIPEIAVDVTAAEDVFDDELSAEEIDDLEPDIDQPLDEEPVEIDESNTSTPSLTDDSYEEDQGDPGMTATLGMNRSAEGNAGRDKGRGGPGGLGTSSSASIAHKVTQLRQSGLDIVVVLDTTSSMDREIAAAKDQVVTLIATLEGLGIEFRLGVVAFRDRGASERYLTLDEALTNRVYKAVDFIDRLNTGGGGDVPEAILEALEVATEMKFARKAEKILVLVGDAPPHAETNDRIANLLARFQDKGGMLHTIFAETKSSRGSREAFRSLAERGGGRSVDLSDARRLVRDVLALTLASNSQEEIEAILQDLDSGRAVDAIRRRLKQHDPGFVSTMLRAVPLHPRLPLELARENHRNFLTAYLDILGDREVAEESRWLATVMLRRLVRDLGRTGFVPKTVTAAVDSLDPEAPVTQRKRTLEQLGQALYDAGMLELELARPR